MNSLAALVEVPDGWNWGGMDRASVGEKNENSSIQNKGTYTWRQSLESICQFCTISPSAPFELWACSRCAQ